MKLVDFEQLPIIGILRGINAAMVESLVACIFEGGLRTIEITMNTPDAPRLIRQMSNAARGRFSVGAGTVCSTDDMHNALEAGATFIVMPTLIAEVVTYCKNNNIPVFPGAFTPQEIFNAWHAGATMVKVFPANMFGPSYLKAIKGPFNDIKLLACGGVNPDTIGSFFSCGASAVAFGASIFSRDALEAGQHENITSAIKNLISAYNNQ